MHAASLTAMSSDILIQTCFIKAMTTKINLIIFVLLKGSLIWCDAVPHLPLRVWDHFALIFGLGFGPEGRFGASRCQRPGSAGWQYKSFFGSKATLEGRNLPTTCFKTWETQIS